jgi:endonuclease-3
LLARQFLPKMYRDAHLNLIRLGREICQARRPACEICPLTDLCDYYAALQRKPPRRRTDEGSQ